MLEIFLFQKIRVYIKFEIHISPPPFFFLILAKMKFIIMRSCTPRAKNVQPFFCNFVNFKSIGEKICILFTKWGKNIHCPSPPFFIPFQSFFPPTCFFLGGSEKYTPLSKTDICIHKKKHFTSLYPLRPRGGG